MICSTYRWQREQNHAICCMYKSPSNRTILGGTLFQPFAFASFSSTARPILKSLNVPVGYFDGSVLQSEPSQHSVTMKRITEAHRYANGMIYRRRT